MAAGRIHHWKHGWIPISPEARAYVAGRGPRPGASIPSEPTPQQAREILKQRAKIKKVSVDDLLEQLNAPSMPVGEKPKNLQDTVGDVDFYEGSYRLSKTQKAEIAKAVDEFFTEFPKLRQKVPVRAEISDDMSMPDAYATTDMRHDAGHMIELNATLFDDAALEALVHDPSTRSVSLVGQANSADAFRELAVKHEMGHFLNATMREDAGYTGFAGDEPHGPLDELSAEMVTPRQMGYTQTQSGDESALDQPVPRWAADNLNKRSAYAISGSPDEWIAEAILDGMIMDHPSTGGRRAYKIAKKEYGP